NQWLPKNIPFAFSYFGVLFGIHHDLLKHYVLCDWVVQNPLFELEQFEANHSHTAGAIRTTEMKEIGYFGDKLPMYQMIAKVLKKLGVFIWALRRQEIMFLLIGGAVEDSYKSFNVLISRNNRMNRTIESLILQASKKV
ncbi:hypothetical protein ACJX0J_016281, partial [Zea mays]